MRRPLRIESAFAPARRGIDLTGAAYELLVPEHRVLVRGGDTIDATTLHAVRVERKKERRTEAS
jgi:hypothetical protein